MLMLERRLRQAGITKGVECMALDGGLRQGDNKTQVLLVYDNNVMENVKPGSLDDELNGKAFSGNIGEFCFSSIPVEEMTDKEHLFCDALMHICSLKEVKRIMVVPDGEKYIEGVKRSLRNVDKEKHVTVFAMHPLPGGNFRQEILGYSLMAALGISSEELDKRENI